MTDALVEITKKGFGCVGMVDASPMVGVFTDGDLRRHIGNDLTKAQRRRDHDAHAAHDRPTCWPAKPSPLLR